MHILFRCLPIKLVYSTVYVVLLETFYSYSIILQWGIAVLVTAAVFVTKTQRGGVLQSHVERSPLIC